MTGVRPGWLPERARELPDRIAVEDESRALTYAELDAWAATIAHSLEAAGVQPGDRVALLAPNSLEFAAAVHGVMRAGAILVPLNLRLTVAEQAWQVEHAEARVLLFHEDVAHVAEELSSACGVPLTPCPSPPRGRGESSPERGATPAPLLPIGEKGLGDEGSPAAIIYTSGTTGRPKGAILTFANLRASAEASAANIGVHPEDRWLACMPLFHVGGLSILTRSALYGTTAVIRGGFNETSVNRDLREGGITLLSVVPTMLARMLDVDHGPFPPSVRAVLVGGGPVGRELLERALARGLPVLQTYGLTESCSQVSTLSPEDAVAHVGSAGKALPGTELRIDAAAGEAGEILVSGPTVTPGYWRDPDATAGSIRAGWLHTGDIGRFDEQGFLYVLDRRDDLILTGGENVYPAEVEAVLREHPTIDDVAVVGVPDAEWGQIVVAAVVANEAWDEPATSAWLRERLAGYKVPRRWVIVEDLPRTASGKVRRHVVRERVAGCPRGDFVN